MNRFTSFSSVILLFLLLSGVVFFGFFVLTPKIKAYRALNIDVEQSSSGLSELEKEFDKQYKALQNLQERDSHVDAALKKQFVPERFAADFKSYFSALELRSVKHDKVEKVAVDTLEVNAEMNSPTAFYHFVEALNRFDWVVEMEGPLTFRAKEGGIAAHFTLKVYTLPSAI